MRDMLPTSVELSVYLNNTNVPIHTFENKKVSYLKIRNKILKQKSCGVKNVQKWRQIAS